MWTNMFALRRWGRFKSNRICGGQERGEFRGWPHAAVRGGTTSNAVELQCRRMGNALQTMDVKMGSVKWSLQKSTWGRG